MNALIANECFNAIANSNVNVNECSLEWMLRKNANANANVNANECLLNGCKCECAWMNVLRMIANVICKCIM